MDTHHRLRAIIDQQQLLLRAAVPPDRRAAMLALLRALDRLPTSPGSESEQLRDLISGRHHNALGANKAFQLCFEAGASEAGEPGSSTAELDHWATQFLAACGRLAEVELVLTHGETGFMRLVDDGNGIFNAWTATKLVPPSWRERADIDWWASSLAARYEPEMHALQTARPDPASAASAGDDIYLRLAAVHLKMMAYQLGYPPTAEIAGCTIQIYRDLLRHLIAWALQEHDRGESPTPQSEPALIATLASALAADPTVIAPAVATFTLDETNAAYHAAVPGGAAAPLVRLGPDELVWSIHGVTTEPLFFLTRELRRRATEEYHNSAYLREAVFRQDLYALFPDKRFVTSTSRIKLRRDVGDVRTDIDAVVFDRKTGSLGLFELKSQDPFARSAAELARQRDNVLYANRQISGILAWLQRHGADEILDRVDHRTAKTFRVQKIFPFVLGRYLIHFNDGPPPDRRAAWGTWPQLLRLLNGEPFPAVTANPLATLFTRLTADKPIIQPPVTAPPREIALGDARLIVYPSYAAFQASSVNGPGITIVEAVGNS